MQEHSLPQTTRHATREDSTVTGLEKPRHKKLETSVWKELTRRSRDVEHNSLLHEPSLAVHQVHHRLGHAQVRTS